MNSIHNVNESEIIFPLLVHSGPRGNKCVVQGGSGLSGVDHGGAEVSPPAGTTTVPTESTNQT